MGAIFDLLIVLVVAGVISSKIKKRSGRQDKRKKQPQVQTKQAEYNAKVINDVVQQRIDLEAVSKTADDDEYASKKSYKTEEAPYKEKKVFKEAEHESAYDASANTSDFTQMEKAVVMAEIIGKPVSMKRRNF